MAGVGVGERAVPAIGVELADVVQQHPREHQFRVGAGDARDGAGDHGDFDRVLEESPQRRVMARDARRAALVAAAEVVLVVEQREDGSEPRLRDLTAPGVELFPVRRHVADRRQEPSRIHAARRE